MPLATAEARSRSQSGATAAPPAHSSTNSPALADDEEITVWQPAEPRLRMFSPAVPRPGSAAATSPRRTAAGAAAGVAAHHRETSPTHRPASAFCGKLSIPGENERFLTPTVSSPGAAPAGPSRAAHILNKVQVIQARASAAPQNLGLLFGAPTAAAAAAASPSAPYDSPPGSPLLVVRSVTRPLPLRLPTATSTSPGSPPFPTTPDRTRRFSMPGPFLPASASGGGLQLPPPTPPGATADLFQGGGADGPAAPPAAPGAASLPGSPRGVEASARGTSGARQRVRSLLASSSGVRTLGADGGDGSSTALAAAGGSRRLTGVGDGSGVFSDAGGESSAGEECGRSRGRGGGGGGGSECGGGGGESGGEGRAHYRRPSIVAPGASGRFSSVAAAAAPPPLPSAPSAAGSPSTSPSASPVLWPWSHDSSRGHSAADVSAFGASQANPSFLNYLNLPNYHNHLSHLNPLHHLSLQLDGRGSILPLPSRSTVGFSSPVRPVSSAALLVSSRSVSVRSRPRSSSVGGAANAAALARPSLSITGRSPPGSAGGAAAAAGGSGGGAVAAAAAAMPPGTMYEIMPDLHSLPAAAAATAIPPGGRVARAIAGILPSGNPGTFNLKVEERIHQVLREGVTKTASAKTAAAAPNPSVLKMLHDRHEAEAQRNRVETAFSSGNPAVWMHQIMAETGAAAPPWSAALAQQQQQQQRQAQQVRQTQQQRQQPQQQGRLNHAQSGRQPGNSKQLSRQKSIKSQRSLTQQQQQQQQQQLQPVKLMSKTSNVQPFVGAAAAGAAAAAAAAAAGGGSLPQRLSSALGPGVPRHTSAETLHLQSMSYLASKEACRTLAADARPAVSINLREVLLEGAAAGGGSGGGASPVRPRSGAGKVRFQE
ncbi:hypothetical protein PLESTB_000801400 [Pleodorina starrii]|uniref:Uncharacterized protein n=1 Tax=Pleodorina starrii TaxID=330485 RepID=A0A9W6BKK5_9CHLO|nr:hypothetical protein PLESTM_000635400 [Pleodorina starrii]GLC53897.1 hypothetical protein PLESTB_000801400 [Pleodorina starrii]GLC75417.1 hypothetical protein PLESTF_001634600 [Pleodorina starrii]